MEEETKKSTDNNNISDDTNKITEAVKDIAVQDNADNNNEDIKENENKEKTNVTIQVTDETGETTCQAEDKTSQDVTNQDTTALEAISEV